MMYDWIVANGYHPVIIATKLDKLKRSQVAKQIKVLRQGLGMEKDDILIPFSACLLYTSSGYRDSDCS